MPATQLSLISHALCPYVQRVAIVLVEKGLSFERSDIDLANKPDWFRKISPLGKTPVLLVDGIPIFESAVICEYLEDTHAPRLHPENSMQRAQHRAWVEFGSATLNTIAGFYNAADDEALTAKATELAHKFIQVEDALGDGPFFSGPDFSIVDAVYGSIFRYFDVFDTIGGFRFFDNAPKVRAWRRALAARPSIRNAVRDDYNDLLIKFLLARNSALAKRFTMTPA